MSDPGWYDEAKKQELEYRKKSANAGVFRQIQS